MVNIIATASELGYLNVPDNTLIEIDEMKNYPPEKMILQSRPEARASPWLRCRGWRRTYTAR